MIRRRHLASISPLNLVVTLTSPDLTWHFPAKSSVKIYPHNFDTKYCSLKFQSSILSRLLCIGRNVCTPGDCKLLKNVCVYWIRDPAIRGKVDDVAGTLFSILYRRQRGTVLRSPSQIPPLKRGNGERGQRRDWELRRCTSFSLSLCCATILTSVTSQSDVG